MAFGNPAISGETRGFASLLHSRFALSFAFFISFSMCLKFYKPYYNIKTSHYSVMHKT